MANVIKKTTNRFGKGLVMDFSPENTKNEVLTNALNATLLTFNGNELSLQNDQGNARVETAYLPTGYMPVGTCEYGGIIYIVSYNPLEDKAQIGCFPSPERNISNLELGMPAQSLSNADFQGEEGTIKNLTKQILLRSDKLNPGDKFVVYANDAIYEEQLKDLYRDDKLIENPVIALNVVSIEESGKITYLNTDLRQYSKGNYKYHILGSDKTDYTSNPDIDSYRNALSSGYNVFKSKTSGKLAILAELITIDAYSVTHSLEYDENSKGFKIVLHHDISPEITDENKTQVPKIATYFLEKSQGYLQTFDKVVSENFQSILLNEVYTPISASSEDLNKTIGGDKGEFDFPIAGTCYQGTVIDGNKYSDTYLAYIKLPDFVSSNGLDLPFKYDYTITPCMSFGKLHHLSVSNTIDFSKLHAFNLSNFTTWKYHIDGNQLRLTFGAEIFDTYETSKVDGLILEFYDLWGFAGSLEITGKKSYSGIFTKTIPLDALHALSRKKVVGNAYSESFAHNIAIQYKKEEKQYTLNEKVVEYDSTNGWQYLNGPSVENDCGTLYTNLLYGVKTYLRRPSDKEYEFFPKDTFFLYTLPIYNDYYYRVNNFNTLHNPALNLMLTYKLVDSGEKIDFTSDSIINGYTVNDYEVVQQYLKGEYKTTDAFEITKYYNFLGTTSLYLELGLKNEYQDLNLSYDPAINNIYKCKLKLLSEDSESSSFSVTSSNEATNDINTVLNYTTDMSLEKNNYLTFNESSSEHLVAEDFDKHNFIHVSDDGPFPIELHYSFVVGYKVKVEDIVTTNIPLTTVCALYHQNSDGVYNLEDFGIYTQEVGEGNNVTIQYLSNSMFYNEGDAENEVFGVCRHIQTDGTVNEQCRSLNSVESPAQIIRSAGHLNAGEPLKQMSSYIGKLSFCQPHVHGLSEVNGVNIQESDRGNTDQYGIAPDMKEDDSRGIIPSVLMRNDPRYNLAAITKKSLVLYDEFISAVDYKLIENGKIISNDKEQIEWVGVGAMREFTGISGEKLAKFNEYLLNTMKSVYTYNPDYSSLPVNVGNITTEDNKVKFISNVVNTYSALDFDSGKTLNDYIYIGTCLFSDYLNALTAHSDIKTLGGDDNNKKPLPQVQFIPNYTYCGTPENYYLINTLTYDIPSSAEDIEKELTLQASDRILVKHSDGSKVFLKGVIDKKALYGFNEKYNKLVQLDVSNYTIQQKEDIDGNPAGTLHLINTDTTVEEKPFTHKGNEPVNSEIFKGEDIQTTFSVERGKSFIADGSRKILAESSNYLYCRVHFRQDMDEVTLTLPFTPSSSNAQYKYSIKNISVVGDLNNLSAPFCVVQGASTNLPTPLLNDSDSIQLPNNSVSVDIFEKYLNEVAELDVFIAGESTDHPFKDNALAAKTNRELWYNGTSFKTDPPTVTYEGNQVRLTYRLYNLDYKDKKVYIRFTIPDIEYTIERVGSIELVTTDVVTTPITKQYSKIDNHKYSVLPKFEESCLWGTSITLNDLTYDSGVGNHRLFMKNGIYSYDNHLRGKLYYRNQNNGKWHDSWEYSKTKDLNTLFLYTGPCFV